MSMDEKRAEVVREIHRLEAALCKTKSPYLVQDYGKAIKRLYRELDTYDRFKRRA